MNQWPCKKLAVYGVAAVLLAVFLVPVRPAAAQAPVVRGELARLARQAYDYNYRNSNRNVFRRSRHYHPTKNVFRSSRYYQQRLAASFDGYPVRTIVRYTRETSRGPREEVYSFVHPRRHPYGPGTNWDVGGCSGPVDAVLGGGPLRGQRRFETVSLPEPAPTAPRPRTRAEIETVPVHVVRRPVRERAVMRTVARADGTTTTVISSEPLDPAGDDGARLAAADDAGGTIGVDEHADP